MAMAPAGSLAVNAWASSSSLLRPVRLPVIVPPGSCGDEKWSTSNKVTASATRAAPAGREKRLQSATNDRFLVATSPVGSTGAVTLGAEELASPAAVKPVVALAVAPPEAGSRVGPPRAVGTREGGSRTREGGSRTVGCPAVPRRGPEEHGSALGRPALSKATSSSSVVDAGAPAPEAATAGRSACPFLLQRANAIASPPAPASAAKPGRAHTRTSKPAAGGFSRIAEP